MQEFNHGGRAKCVCVCFPFFFYVAPVHEELFVVINYVQQMFSHNLQIMLLPSQRRASDTRVHRFTSYWGCI